MNQESKSIALRNLLKRKDLSFIMEAHSGLSAVIVEEAGFEGIWASGLSMSAMTGCRDRNELDISEVCKIVEWMADHTSIPILVDGDTGGVDINSARILADKLIKAGAAGVCIEDKKFPKHNSFLDNGTNDLADVQEFCGKIRSMKEVNSCFVVVARLEEFISKVGLDEAIYRAKAFVDAGADAILVHSKIKDCSEVDMFMRKWKSLDLKYSRTPVVIVPTKYYKTPSDHFREIGISLVIWANHNLRSSIVAMQDTSRRIFADQSLCNVENKIVPVSEVFRLQRDNDAVEAEKRLVNSDSVGGTAFILSGADIGEIPKSLIKTFDNKCYLEVQRRIYSSFGINNIWVLFSHFIESIEVDKPVNVLTEKTGSEVGSLKSIVESCTSDSNFNFPIFISYGDIVFNKSLILKLNGLSSDDIVLVAERDFDRHNYNEYVYTVKSDDPSDNLGGKVVDVSNVKVDSQNSQDTEVGSFIGLIKINTSRGLSLLKNILKSYSISDTIRMISVLSRLVNCSDEISLGCLMCNHEDWLDHDAVVRRFLNDD